MLHIQVWIYIFFTYPFFNIDVSISTSNTITDSNARVEISGSFDLTKITIIRFKLCVVIVPGGVRSRGDYFDIFFICINDRGRAGQVDVWGKLIDLI
ncbi:hypothetical protein QTP88_014968 [Uroleucon formosanum]